MRQHTRIMPQPSRESDAFAGATREILRQHETVEIPSPMAGYPATRKLDPAHRRLARAKRITPEIETAVEQFARDWEMVEGGAHEPGAGGDGGRTREDVMTGAIMRLEQARRRVDPYTIWLVSLCCVECEAAHVTARRMGWGGDTETRSGRQSGREWLDRRLPKILSHMTGYPLDA